MATNEKTYIELSAEEQKTTFENWQKLCEQHPAELVSYSSFEEYDAEQRFLNLSFDAETLECLG